MSFLDMLEAFAQVYTTWDLVIICIVPGYQYCQKKTIDKPYPWWDSKL